MVSELGYSVAVTNICVKCRPHVVRFDTDEEWIAKFLYSLHRRERSGRISAKIVSTQVAI